VASVKSLFKDTAIYGLSSIIGRFLNWCLVPIYTYCFPASEYGIVTNLYAYAALVLIILIYGMETGFFRFANHERWTNPGQVYTTTLISLSTTSMLFMVIGCILSPTIAQWLGCADHPSFIWMMVIALALDAYTAIPFAYLRYRKRPIRFATIKLINIGLNIAFNLFFVIACPAIWKAAPQLISWFYDPTFGVGYIFLANLISSFVTLLLVLPEVTAEHYSFNGKLLREMLSYSFPLLIIGIAGIMNQTLDKILYPMLIPDRHEALTGLGIYGANYKIAIVMVMFIQAFRFAYEPFIFAQNREKGEDKTKAYSTAMNWFVICGLFIFLGVMFYLPIIKYFISPDYFDGLRVVPIVMLAELFFGIFFNLSVWYKITDRTIWGTWFSLLGLIITLAINIIFVPKYGFIACAWAAFSCYGIMMIASYAVGRWKHPIEYNIARLFTYFVVAIGLWGLSTVITTDTDVIDFAVRLLLLGVYALFVYLVEVRRPAASAKKQ
jgi:O-antigen/teichoic acid export membrane protein